MWICVRACVCVCVCVSDSASAKGKAIAAVCGWQKGIFKSLQQAEGARFPLTVTLYSRPILASYEH